MTANKLPDNQTGVALLEALIAIVLFSIGIIALIGLQAFAIKSSSDAKYRADAAYLANQIIGRMWVDDARVGRLSVYAHNPGGGALCAPTVAASAEPAVTEWLAQVASLLPNAAAANQQITVDNANNLVTVTICWRGQAATDVWHNHVTVAQIRPSAE